MSGRVQVDVLGPLRIAADGVEIEVRAGKERAVIEQLALHGGRPVSVDALVDGLWGDRPPATAVKTLQNYVARLRRSLPRGAIVSIAGGYALGAAADDIDAESFQAEVRGGQVALRDGDPDGARRLFTAALSRWRGEPFAELAHQRAGAAVTVRFHELRLAAEDGLADARLVLGEHADLVADLESAARREPTRERRWGQLMTALSRSGRTAEALRAYQDARDALGELGLAPGPELRSLEQAVLSPEPGGIVTSGYGAHEVAPSTRAPLPPAIAALSASPILGRDAEEAAILEHWEVAKASRLGAVVITGEPGIGKTRLLVRAAQLAHADGGLVFFGRCDPEPIAPYQPVVEMLGWFARQTPTGALRIAVGTTATELSRLSPELARRLDIGPQPFVEVDLTGRYRLFDAVTTFLEGCSEQRPVLLAVDDLQWADEGTRLLLAHIRRALPDRRLLLVASARTTEGPMPAADTLGLGGLDAATIARLLAVDPGTAAEVERASGGSPLFLREIQRHALETGRYPAEGDIPIGLQAAVEQRLVGLAPPTRRMLAAAAVAGATSELGVVAAAADVSEHEAIDAADEALGAHVLTEVADGRLTFSHAIVRAAVHDQLSENRRTYLHGRIARALLVSHRADPDAIAGELAHHFSRAAGARADDMALEWCQRAAEHAADRCAWETAADWCARALGHASRDEDRVDLLGRLGAAERAAGAATTAKAHFAEAIDLARTIGPPARYARAVLAWASVPVDVRRELDEVIRALRDAAAGLEDDAEADPDAGHDEALQAAVLGRLAFSLGWANADDARAVSDRAVDLARRAGDPRTLANVLLWCQSTHTTLELAAPGGFFEEARGLAMELDDPALAAVLDLRMAVGAVHRGDRDAADDALATARDRLTRHPLPDQEFQLAKCEGDLWLVDGDVERAERRADELFERAGRVDLRNLWLFASSLLFDVRRWQGRLGELAPWFDRLADRGERVPKVGAMRAEVLAGCGRHDESLALLAGAVADGFRDVAPTELPYSLHTLGTVAADLGAVDAAPALHDALLPMRGFVAYDGDTGVRGAIDLPLGRLATMLGHYDEARGYLATARALHAGLRSPSLLSLSTVADAELLAATTAPA